MKVFTQQNFWKLYLDLLGTLYDEEGEIIGELDKAVPEQLIKELEKDFEIQVNHSEGVYDWRFKGTPLEGKRYERTTKFVHFVFMVGSFELLIEFNIELNGSVINLYLFHEEEEYFLGWRDCARWHPYCLRYEELQLILEQINRHDEQWANSPVPLLLLKNFVGFGIAEEANRKALVQQAEEAIKILGISNSSYYAECETKEKYNWIETELGWEFTAKYSCYSLRNADHKDSKEGQFPFELWKELMGGIE